MSPRYCPKCGTEFQGWVEKCLDCNAPLVDTKPEMVLEPEGTSKPETIDIGDETYTSEPLVKVAEYEDAVTAQFNKDVLESEGIKSMVFDGNSAGSWVGIRPKMPVSLIVRQADAEKAQEILNSIDESEPITIVPDAEAAEDDTDDGGKDT
jgi:hypothetical protein